MFLGVGIILLIAAWSLAALGVWFDHKRCASFQEDVVLATTGEVPASSSGSRDKLDLSVDGKSPLCYGMAFLCVCLAFLCAILSLS